MKLKKQIEIEIEIDINCSELADLFWGMDSNEQAIFFNKMGQNDKFDIAMQLGHVTQSVYLDDDGRDFMNQIGNYSDHNKGSRN